MTEEPEWPDVTSRTYLLQEDAQEKGDSVILHYGFGACLNKDRCPPVKELKAGTPIEVFYWMVGTIKEIRLASPGNFGWLIGGKVTGFTSLEERLQEINIKVGSIEFNLRAAPVLICEPGSSLLWHDSSGQAFRMMRQEEINKD